MLHWLRGNWALIDSKLGHTFCPNSDLNQPRYSGPVHCGTAYGVQTALHAAGPRAHLLFAWMPQRPKHESWAEFTVATTIVLSLM